MHAVATLPELPHQDHEEEPEDECDRCRDVLPRKHLLMMDEKHQLCVDCIADIIRDGE